MKYATLALMGIGLAIGTSIAIGQAPSPKGEPEMKTVEQKYAYLIGQDLGSKMKAADVNLDADFIAKGIKDALADKRAFTEAQSMEIAKAFEGVMKAKQAAAMGDPDKNLKEGQAFLAANKTKPGVVTLPSGVQYKVIKSGTGKTPKLTDTVVANYRGTLINGAEFDSSYKRGEPAEFPVGRVIKGWTEILQKMKVGDKWEVYIPTELAYGMSPTSPKIRPNDALIFEIDLIDVK
jgi:FKBP-type peptidyl-prolyl cis-trans isomerase FklB